MPKYSKDLTGMKFGRLLVVARGERNSHGHYQWLCSCECGNQVQAWGTNLTSGKTRSCGCLVVDVHTKHGESGSLLYQRWGNMVAR